MSNQSSKFIPSQNLFFCAQKATQLKANHINIIGFEYDETACFRKGAVLAPNAIRDLSDGLESYSPYLDKDLEDVTFYDLGNLPTNSKQPWETAIQYFTEIISKTCLKENNIKLITLGGEHSISYPMIKSALENYPELLLIQLDAHADLRDGYEGYHYSHASIIRRSLDHFTSKHKLIQYGIRSGTRDEYKWMNKNKTLISSLDKMIDYLNQIDEKRPIYLTLDLDFFDPSILPGTGTPEAGGETFHSFIKIIKILNKKNLIGADVVELSPPLDLSNNSTIFASKVVRELILSMI